MNPLWRMKLAFFLLLLSFHLKFMMHLRCNCLCLYLVFVSPWVTWATGGEGFVFRWRHRQRAKTKTATHEEGGSCWVQVVGRDGNCIIEQVTKLLLCLWVVCVCIAKCRISNDLYLSLIATSVLTVFTSLSSFSFGWYCSRMCAWVVKMKFARLEQSPITAAA